jgi:hypothetical protein
LQRFTPFDQAAHNVGHEGVSHDGHQTHPNRGPYVGRASLLQGGVQPGQAVRHPGQHTGTGRRQAPTPYVSIDQGRAKSRLQVLEQIAYRRLAEVKRFGAGGQGTKLRQQGQKTQMLNPQTPQTRDDVGYAN